MTYTVEPTDHWRPGDRAYCVRGLKHGGRHIVEAGRIYRVAEVRRWDNMMNDGLRLEGIEYPPDRWGFTSSRFVCIREGTPIMQQIAERTRHGWYDAYKECGDARAKVHCA